MKEQLQKDFIVAMKNKDVVSKAALSSLKAAITTEEKAKLRDLNEVEIIKIIAKQIKQREQSEVEFTKGGRGELAAQERQEAEVLQKYLPAQMSEANVRKELKIIMSGLNMPNAQALRGKSIGEFNKSFPGAADISVVKQIAEELVAGL